VAAQSTTVASCYPAAKPGRPEAVAVIPEMGWQELTDEALIARSRGSRPGGKG
jgi:hypothetical protein